MRKELVKLLIMFTLIVGISVAASAQATPKPIQIPKGKTQTVVNGTGMQNYTIKLADNQELKLKLVSKGNKATYSLFDSAGSDLSEGSDGLSFEGSFAAGGEYKIQISAPRGLAFTLTVSVK